MAWIVGIDEAGYGPNLGPFVMTSVACQAPDPVSGDLWQALRTAVRRRGEKPDGRFLVEDSKLVYSTARGLADLETGVLATASPCRADTALTVARLIDHLCPTAHDELRGEPWYSGATAVPIQVTVDVFGACAERFVEASRQCGVTWGTVRSLVVCPPRFNALLDRWDNKSVILSLGLVELVTQNRSPDEGNDPVRFFVDKQGGRNSYAPT